MPSLEIVLKDIGTFVPIMDDRKNQTPSVIKGQNFVFDVDGPRSGFNTEFPNWFQFGAETAKVIREFRVENELFYGTPTGIWKIDGISLEPIQLLDLKVNPLFKYWPWTFAQVGNQFYFAQHNRGLWQYNPVTFVWKEINTPEGKNIKGICASYGRLICLGASTVMWSSLDNGADLVPSLVTGAGFQALSILSQNAFRVDPVSDGIIVSTDQGWIKGEFVAANYIFRWYNLSTDVRAFSPNMSVVIPDAGLVTLDAGGFHVSAGQKPQPWETEMGEYIKRTFIETTDKRRFGCFQLYYSHAARQLFVSIAPNSREGSFVITFVLNMPNAKWGVLSWPHQGIFDYLKKPFNLELNGMMNMDGFMEIFTRKTDKEILPEAPAALLDYLARLFSEPALRITQTLEDKELVWVGITDLWWTDYQLILLQNAIPITGLYQISLTANPQNALSSSIYFESTPPIPSDPAWVGFS